ncbi:hypothetical protein ACFPYJ_31525 [Paenibacillus solisilvae]|uniref:RNase H type-1 domain-containing protein n=1 Tax=Paenibacillus solisilvae TaxID=2486751 RepID=A0ABW0W793_9BACL
MDNNMDKLIMQAYATPPVRANIVNKGMISLYCDYSGCTDQNAHGVACCFVYNRTILVRAKNLNQHYDGGSDFGELQAIVFSLQILTEALIAHQMSTVPKFAVVFTDCHGITKILAKTIFHNPYYEEVRNEILASLSGLQAMFPEIQVRVTYISNHKKNNPLHKMAHNAARKSIGK